MSPALPVSLFAPFVGVIAMLVLLSVTIRVILSLAPSGTEDRPATE